MVVASATLVTMSGAAILDDYRRLAGAESTTNTIEEMDTKLSSVASVRGVTRTEVSLGDENPGRYNVVQGGSIEIAANKKESCTTHIGLGSIQYEEEDGDIVAFEAGGIWNLPDGRAETIMHTPPDLTFDEGTLSLSVINVTGDITEKDFLLLENVEKSKAKNTEIDSTLFNETCERPDNITLTIQSDFYEGWARYLENEVNATNQTTYDSNKTVRVFFDQDALPEETNDEINNVVDLSDSSFNDVDMTNQSIMVDKNANNTYTVVMTPLTTGSTQVGEFRKAEGNVVFRQPMDVVFVLDESGSMGNTDDDAVTRMREAKDASQTFVGQMNDSYDRAGAVGFDDDARYLKNLGGEEVYLSNKFDGVNDSIETLSAGGNTFAGKGIRKAMRIHGLKSNSSRTRAMVLLSDGRDDGDPLPAAQEADKNGITIHAVGFGSNADNATLEAVANTTGGTYRHVSTSEDLSDVFKEIFARIAESKQIVKDPLVVKMTGASTTYQAQIDGETTHIAKTTDGSPNVNDPKLPSKFAFSIDVKDGENVSITGLKYGCNEWKRTTTVHTNQTTGEKYNVVRCSDFNESDSTEVTAANMTVYLDGDDVSSLLNEPQNWWNEDLRNETMASHLEADNETLDLESNEAIFVVRFPDGDSGTDMLIAKYEIGQSKEETVPKYVFNIIVRYLEIR